MFETDAVRQVDFENLRNAIEAAEKRWSHNFDDLNTLNDWNTYVGIYMARATAMENKDNPGIVYDALIKAAGLALSAAARLDGGLPMAPRHYDSW